jgi:hypothetical protein
MHKPISYLIGTPDGPTDHETPQFTLFLYEMLCTRKEINHGR